MESAFMDVVGYDAFRKINLYNWTKAKSHLKMRIISKKNMQKYAHKEVVSIPHVSFFNIAYVGAFMEDNGECVVSHLVNTGDLDTYSLEPDEIFSIGFSNMKNDNNVRLIPLSEYFSRMSEPYFAITKQKGVLNSRYGEIIDKTDGIYNVLMCSSSTIVFGASYAFIDSTLDKVRKKFRGESYYIVPLSIHQVLFVRKKYLTEVCKQYVFDAERNMLDMLHELNSIQAEDGADNILSDYLYYYDAEDGQRIMLVK